MAPSAREKVNFFRLLCAVIDVLTPILRDLLTQEVPHEKFPVKDKQILKSLHLNDDQKQVLRRIPKVRYKECDISILYKFLSNLCTSIPAPTHGWHQKKSPKQHNTTIGDDIERIRLLRNELPGHMYQAAVDDKKFERTWNSIKDICRRMRSYMGTHVDYLSEIEDIEKRPLDEEREKELTAKVKNTQYFEDNINELKEQMEEFKKIVQPSEWEQIKTWIEINQEKMNFMLTMGEVVEKINEVVTEQISSHRSFYQHYEEKRNRIIDKWEDDDTVFVEATRVFQSFNKTIRCHSVVIVIGGPGCGKTFFVRHIALKLKMEEWEVIPIAKAEDLYHFHRSDIFQIFVFENVFGEYDLRNKKVEEFKRYFNFISADFSHNSKLVMTCRRPVYYNASKRYEKFLKSFQVFDLENDQLSLNGEEKMQILSAHCRKRNLNTSIVAHMQLPPTNFMFPLICKCFSENKIYQDRGEVFFHKPFEVYESEICSLQSENAMYYGVLLLCLFKNGSIPRETFNQKCQSVILEIFDNCVRKQKPNRKDLKEAMFEMTNTYIVDVKNYFTFINSVLSEALIFYVAEAHLDLILKYVHIDHYFIYHDIHVTNSGNILIFNNEVKDDGEVFVNLVKRVYNDIKEHHMIELLQHKLFTNTIFCMKFIDHLRGGLKIEETENVFLLNKYTKSIEKGEFSCELVCRGVDWIAFTGNTRLLRFIVTHAKNFRTIFGKDKEEQIIILFLGCLSENEDVLRLIIQNIDNSYINTQLKASGTTPLIEVCRLKNPRMVETLLRAGAGVNVTDDNANTPLIVAAESGSVKIVKKLLGPKNCIKVNDKNKYGKTALFQACKHGNLTIVQELIRHGADLNTLDIKKMTPLTTALENGHQIVAEVLLQKGANVSKCSKSPLHAAIEMGFYTIVEQCLLQNRALVNKCDRKKQSPLFKAAECGSLDIVKLLIQRMADVDLYEKNYHMNPLHIAAKNGYLEIIQYLIDERKGSLFVNKCDIRDRTSLYLASCAGHKDIAQFLIEKGANIEKRDCHGRTALFAASEAGQVETVTVLVQNGADVNVHDSNNLTPLLVATKFRHFEVCHILLENDVEVNTIDRNQNSPLLLAIKNNNKSLVVDFVEHGAHVDAIVKDQTPPLYLALEKNYHDIVSFLLSKNAKVNIEDENGRSLLHIVAERGDYDLLQRLVTQHKADVNVRDQNGVTLLHTAAQIGCFKITKFLLECTDIRILDRSDNKLRRPLHYAAENGYPNIVESLIKAKSKLNEVDNEGMSPLSLASLNGHHYVVSILIEHEADVNTGSKMNKPPLLLALENRHFEIARLLLDEGADLNNCEKILIVAIRSREKDIIERVIAKSNGVDKCDSDEQSPLLNAVMGGDQEIIQCLLRNKANVNLCDKNGKSPLLVGVENENIDIVDMLISSGADVDACDYNDRSPLKVALQNNCSAISKCLIEHNVDLNRCETFPLTIASMNGDLDVVRFLVEHKANINKYDQLDELYNLPPLMMAIKYNRIDVAKYLIYEGADIDVHEVTQDSGILEYPLQMASERGQLDIVQLLLQNGAAVNKTHGNTKSSLYAACRKGRKDIVEYLSENKVDIESGDENNASPLYVSSEMGHHEIVQYLLERNANVNRCETKSKQTSLHIASKNGHLSVVRLLLKYNSRINACNSQGQTALHLAAKKCHLNVVKEMLHNGAKPDLTDIHGMSPLFIAISDKDEIENKESKIIDILRSLIKSDSKVNLCQNRERLTPLHLASMNGFPIIVKFLIDHGAVVNKVDSKKRSPLHLAALNGDLEVATLLLKNGARVDMLDNKRRTPRSIAKDEVRNVIEQYHDQTKSISVHGRIPTYKQARR